MGVSAPGRQPPWLLERMLRIWTAPRGGRDEGVGRVTGPQCCGTEARPGSTRDLAQHPGADRKKPRPGPCGLPRPCRRARLAASRSFCETLSHGHRHTRDTGRGRPSLCREDVACHGGSQAECPWLRWSLGPGCGQGRPEESLASLCASLGGGHGPASLQGQKPGSPGSP